MGITIIRPPASIGGVTEQINSLQSDVSSLEIDVSGHTSDIGALQSDMSVALSDIGVLQSDIMEIEFANIVHVDIGDSIQDAIDAIDTATESNWFLIQLGPGAYSEEIVCKPYIAIRGSGERETKLSISSGNMFTVDGGNVDKLYHFSDMEINCVASVGPVTILLSTNYSVCYLNNIHIVLVVPDPIVVDPFDAKVSSGTFAGLFLSGSMEITYVGLAEDDIDRSIIDVSGSYLIFGDSVINLLLLNTCSGDFTIIKDSITSNMEVSSIKLLCSISAPYSGTLRVLDSLGDGLRTFNNCNLSLSSVGGAFQFAKLYSANGGNMLLSSSNIICSGFTTAIIGDVSIKDGMSSVFCNLAGIDEPQHIGAGSYDHIATVDGVLRVTTDIVDENMSIGDSTYESIRDMFNLGLSAGWNSGGAITDNGDGTVNIASGTGAIRINTTDASQLKMFDWIASNNIVLGNNDFNLIYIDYNSGSPIVANAIGEVQEELILNNERTKFELYEIHRSGTTLTIIDHKQKCNDAIGGIQKLFHDCYRSLHGEGLVISNTGTRNIAVTEGDIWIKTTENLIAAIDTSGASRFWTYYRGATPGTWTEATNVSQWQNTSYDDGDGTLGTVGTSKFGYNDFYLVPNGVTGRLVMIYGQATSDGQYSTAESAALASRSATLPQLIADHGLYIGRIVFEKSNNTPALVRSAFL